MNEFTIRYYMICLTNGNFFKLQADEILEKGNEIIFKMDGIKIGVFYSQNIAGWAEIFDVKEE